MKKGDVEDGKLEIKTLIYIYIYMYISSYIPIDLVEKVQLPSAVRGRKRV